MFSLRPRTRQTIRIFHREFRTPGAVLCVLLTVWCLRHSNKRDIDDIVLMRNERYWNYQASESNRKGPGEMGKAVKLSPEQAEKYKDVNEKEGFNFGASELVALDRSLPDTRYQVCKDRSYPTDLPKASVIISYFNEAPSVILRTVHSVVNRSPPQFLEEVVLLDDSSDRPDVLEPMHAYIERTWPDGVVRVVRTPQRYGLIKAKWYGAQAARGPVLIFLDAHCEVGAGWIEPLLSEIHGDPTRVVCPSVASIHLDTLEFELRRIGSRGGFTWSMFFTWESRQPSELAASMGPEYAYPSPTMAGGLLAVDKNFFFRIGAYDGDMEIWGGENLDLSFRTWMCGGSLLFHPCSIVGHMFRPTHPYGFPDKKRDYHRRNTKRMVEVWLDEYNKYYYFHRPDLPAVNVGDLSERRAIRDREQCKSFQWYLDTVYPEKFKLDQNVQYFGDLRNPSTNFCLDMLANNERSTFKIGVYYCSDKVTMNQLLSATKEGWLRTEFTCMAYRSPREILMDTRCQADNKAQLWLHNEDTGQCLDVKGLNKSEPIRTSACDSSDTQRWEWFSL